MEKPQGYVSQWRLQGFICFVKLFMDLNKVLVPSLWSSVASLLPMASYHIL